MGAGQVSRVDSVEIAIRKSGENIQGSILCSDAFFPLETALIKLQKQVLKQSYSPAGPSGTRKSSMPAMKMVSPWSLQVKGVLNTSLTFYISPVQVKRVIFNNLTIFRNPGHKSTPLRSVDSCSGMMRLKPFYSTPIRLDSKAKR